MRSATMMDRVFSVIRRGDPDVGVVRVDIEETLGITTSQARTALRALKAKGRIRVDRFDPETMEACYVFVPAAEQRHRRKGE